MARMTRLSENVVEDGALRDRARVFRERKQAGRVLADLIRELELSSPVVLAIPSGGVPVAIEVAKALGAKLDLMLARKLQIPGNTEAGFGACTTNGPVFLNRELVSALGLSESEIESAEQKTRAELERREQAFTCLRQGFGRQGGSGPLPALSGREVVLVDDGLASGYTMLAAADYAKERKAARVIAAAPTGHLSTVARVARHADYVVCPNIRGGPRFAVAEAYQIWYDLDDREVIEELESFRKFSA